MNATIQRQYDEVIAPHYDRDPKEVTGNSLDRAGRQIRKHHLLAGAPDPLRVLDLGLGTGLFFSKLKALGIRKIQPFGLDLSPKMIASAQQKHPDLVAEVDDAANLDAHFRDTAFDLVCTHFLTGFVPLAKLAPKVWDRLDEGGYWSIVGGTKAGFPVLQTKAQSNTLSWLFGGRTVLVDDLVCNPANRAEMEKTLAEHGFAVREVETFEPKLKFRDFQEFMDFAYRGGWLTPFIEQLGLHRTGAMSRILMNLLLFPIQDHHSIEIVLAQKVAR